MEKSYEALENALRLSKEKNRQLVENSAIGIATVSLKGEWLSVNPAVCSMLGYTEEELLKIDFQSITHPDDIETDQYYLKQLLSSKIDSCEIEKRFFHKNGSIVWCQLNVTLVKDNKRDPLYFISQIQDFTARKLYQSQLVESESKYRSTFEYALIGIATVDIDGNYLTANPAFCKMLQYTREELLKLDFQTITHPEDLNKELKYLEDLLTLKIDHFTAEKRFQRKDGDSIWVEINVSTVLDDQNNLRYFIHHAQDITERREINKVLEMKVKERTRQLENMNQELQAFSYSVSHDLRSPLRTIHGFCQALEEDYAAELPEKAQNYLKRVSAASVRMGNLIDDLLILSRISRREMNIKKVDLTSLARQVVEDRPEEVEAEFNIHEDMTIEGDEGLLLIVLENLIGNSLKYADKAKDKTKVEVGSKKDEELGDVYFVKDNGVGFDMQYADKLFGAFQRLHSNKEFEGTGIGLATVKRIINRHGGKIWAESEVGKGTTFYFTFSVNKAESLNGFNV